MVGGEVIKPAPPLPSRPVRHMHTERDFQDALDAAPDDHTLRLVFADWLEEQGDPRARGYRALGVTRRVPTTFGSAQWHYSWITDLDWENSKACTVPIPNGDFLYYPKSYTLCECWMALCSRKVGLAGWVFEQRDTRREAEDAAALAFLRLPAERQEELLRTPVLTGGPA